MSDSESQEDELLALASIYDENTFSSSTEKGSPGGQFSAVLELPEPFNVIFMGSDGSKKEHPLRYLPPITLFFQLPEDYPSTQPPLFTLSCKWLTLPQMSKICHKLDTLWEENSGEVILFLWTSFLRDEALDFLKIQSPLDLSNIVCHSSKSDLSSEAHCDSGFGEDLHQNGAYKTDSRAFQDVGSQAQLLRAVLEYDQERREAVFYTTLFTCQVCFSEKLGGLCIQFPSCQHTFCRECMKSYFEVQINDGNVKGLTCPYDKCDSQALPTQVKELVGEELFSRYDRLLLQTSLDTMSDIQYCPRTACAFPVVIDAASDMGSCPKCSFAFCVYCKGTYHGVSPCKIKSEEVKQLREEYMAADSAGQRDLERRYGRVVIRKIIEESFTDDWLHENSKKCPHCNTHIEKIDGCNKMLCTKCRCFFCWLCGAVLSRNNPYFHFSDTRSPCFNLLFEGVDPGEEGFDDDWVGMV